MDTTHTADPGAGAGVISDEERADAVLCAAIDDTILAGQDALGMYGQLVMRRARAASVANTELGAAADRLADRGYLERPGPASTRLLIDGDFRVARILSRLLLDQSTAQPVLRAERVTADLVDHLDAALRTSPTRTVEYLLRARHRLSKHAARRLSRSLTPADLPAAAKLLASAAPVARPDDARTLLRGVLEDTPRRD